MNIKVDFDALLDTDPEYLNPQNHCAHCGSGYIEIEHQEVGIDYLKFTYRCEICGKFGTLKYDVVFNKNEKE